MEKEKEKKCIICKTKYTPEDSIIFPIGSDSAFDSLICWDCLKQQLLQNIKQGEQGEAL